MKRIRIIALMAMMAVGLPSAMAQYVSPVDFMVNNPRSMFANPAFHTNEFGFFDFALGGINIDVQNVGLKYDRFFTFNDAGKPVQINLDKGLASLRDKNYLNANVAWDVFNCGRRTKHGFFTYTHRVRVMETFRYSKDLVSLLAKGNAAYLGENNPANIDLGLAVRGYMEFDFGYQMNLTEKLSIGTRLKYLAGLADLKTNNVNIKLFTDPETYALSLLADADVRAALPLEISMVDGKLQTGDFNLFGMFKNYGLGIDLGGEYRINDQMGVAAAINDLGFISWKTNPIQLQAGLNDAGPFYQDGAFVFSGLTTEQVNNMMDDPNYFSNLTNSLPDYLDMSLEQAQRYTTGLNTSTMVRGYYDLTPEHRFSAQLMTYATGIGVRPALTLAYSGNYNKKYDVVGTYTMMGGSYDNIGIGASANVGGLVLYLATNNLLGFFNPVNRTQLNFQFGLSFVAGEKVNRLATVVLRDKEAGMEEDPLMEEDPIFF